MNNEYPLKLSIIVPVYNVEKYLERCVNSLLHQDINVANMLLHGKETFVSPSYLVGKEWMMIRFQPAYFLIEDTYSSSNICDRAALTTLNFIARTFTFILRHIKK